MSTNGMVKEVVLRCRDKRGVVEYDAQGVPVRFRTVCRNRECCERRVGFHAVHVFTLYCQAEEATEDCRLGDFATVYEPQRPVSDLILALERSA